MNHETIKAILSALESEPTKWQIIIYLALQTDLRCGELTGLCWDCVNTTEHTLHIKRSLRYSPKSGPVFGPLKYGERAIRHITIPPSLSEMLDVWRQEQQELFPQNPHGLCFTTDDGKPLTVQHINMWLGAFCRRHNLPTVRYHQLTRMAMPCI